MSNLSKRITLCAALAALYATLTLALSFIAYGPIQIRVAEALCLIPYYIPESIPGLFLGCLIANLFSPNGLPDIVFGTLATLIAVFLVSKIKIKWLTPLPVILTNGIVVGLMIAIIDTPGNVLPSFLVFGAEVAAGEAIATLALGLPLLLLLPRIPFFRQLFPERFPETTLR